MRVKRRDGIHINGTRHVVLDARSAVGDITVVSHAHSDHVHRTTAEPVICSPETAAIIDARAGITYSSYDPPQDIELVPAGHVVGSSAVVIEDEDTTYCYTGDFSTRDRAYLEGFDPTAVDADVLIMETTYGRPRYRFPPQAELESAIADWLNDNAKRPLVLCGYSLGRAQKLQWLAQQSTNRDILVSPIVADVNEAIESATDGRIQFAGTPTDIDQLSDLSDEILVVPMTQARSAHLVDLIGATDGLIAGFSGWAVDDSYRYRTGCDVTFPLTDHCDYDELLETVQTIDPDRVYTHHGSAASFADDLATAYDYDAQPLLRGQRRLDEFA
ncbi:MAG: mRNA cleavage and polyadenylation specificity factor-like protein [Natrialbaceae archaeon]|nr:mRNA cleavage and polyadenylation specificity factor-like protein [Natrialbaceae archaeon]